MKKFLVFYVLLFFSTSLVADNIGGIAKYSLDDKKLSIPCLKVETNNTLEEDTYFDVILEQIEHVDNTYSFVLSFAEREDEFLCSKVESYSKEEDHNFTEDSNLNNVLDDSNNNIADNNSASIEISCEIRSDRSKISVKGRDLISGDYFAVVNSGGQEVQSSIKHTRLNEVEFDFDSEADDIAAGATSIAIDFINTHVEAAIFDEQNNFVQQSSAACEFKN